MSFGVSAINRGRLFLGSRVNSRQAPMLIEAPSCLVDVPVVQAVRELVIMRRLN